MRAEFFFLSSHAIKSSVEPPSFSLSDISFSAPSAMRVPELRHSFGRKTTFLVANGPLARGDHFHRPYVRQRARPREGNGAFRATIRRDMSMRATRTRVPETRRERESERGTEIRSSRFANTEDAQSRREY